MATVILKPERESSLLRRHPWIFSGAIDRVEGKAQPGQTVEVRTGAGQWLARGAYSPASQIAVRVWTFDASRKVDPTFFRQQLARALALRRSWHEGGARRACRLVNAESDGLPGLVVDGYADFLVCQFLSAGPERWNQAIVAQLAALHPCRGIYERSDVDARQKEGLAPRRGVLQGEDPPDLVEIEEGGLRLVVDIKQGHKTGFYLDQRENRACLADHAAGAEVLNCFSYTGAFGVVALAHGAASVVNVDTSASALTLAARHVEINNLDTSRLENVAGDAFQILREFRRRRRLFDVVVLDPPKFAAARGHLAQASRGYKDINVLAFELLRPGGHLLTFSCSGHMTAELFQKIVAEAALDAGRNVQIVRRLGQASDHPVSLNFPEGHYLKGLLCVVVE